MTSNSTLYQTSEALLARAESSIPLGCQTFSKSKTQFPFGVSPFFAKSGKGAEITDVDGNQFVDFVSALGAVTLGYADPDVELAVINQLKEGTIFTLSHELEVQLAEKIIDMVPCAEKVRFGKNGSDATAACVRLARAYTEREVVLVGGYHGWQDWYIGSTPRNKGVPKSTCELTKGFVYNDIESLKGLLNEFSGKVAAVILEPVSVETPEPGYLESVKKLTHEHGALLIFDEVVSGFRHSNGGAQELYGVVPDLVALGKGFSNGFPLSAVAGRREIMDLLEEVYFSFTYGGETLSLAAALATLEKIQNQEVIQHLNSLGSELMAGVNREIEKYELNALFRMSGHPVLSFLTIKGDAGLDADIVKTLLLQVMMDNGIITLGSHVLNFSHKKEHIDKLVKTYGILFAMIKDNFDNELLKQQLRCEVLRPLFKVRK